MEIEWSRLALARLQEIRAYVALDKPEAAERLAVRIVALVEALKEQPYLGRKGSTADTRELIIGGTSYIAVYRVRAGKIIIADLWHGSQRQQR